MNLEPVVPSATIFLNDRFVAPDEAKVSIFDRGYLFGDAVFETLRSYGGMLFRPGSHLERLLAGAASLGIALPMAEEELRARLLETVVRFGSQDANVRVTLSRGIGGAGIALASAGAGVPTLSIIARPLERYGEDAYTRGIAAGTARARKIPDACLPSGIKTANYLSNVLARRELEQKHMIEGVQLSVGGRIVSGTVSNVFMVVGGRLVTPDVASGCRAGVTREAILGIARRVGVGCDERPVEAEELSSSAELFFANTIMECLPVANFDGRPLPGAPGPVTRALHVELRRLVEAETGISA